MVGFIVLGLGVIGLSFSFSAAMVVAGWWGDRSKRKEDEASLARAAPGGDLFSKDTND